MCKREHFLVLLEPKLDQTCVANELLLLSHYLVIYTLRAESPPFVSVFFTELACVQTPLPSGKIGGGRGGGSAHRLYRVHQMKGSAGREGNVKLSLEKSSKSRSDSLN